MKISLLSWFVSAVVVSAGVAPGATTVTAQMTLTPEGVQRGFTLSTFASGFPSASNIGPISVAYRSDGRVLVTDFADSNIYLLPGHQDGQAGPYPVATAHGPGTHRASGLVQVQDAGQWRYYMTRFNSNQVVEIDEDGALLQVIVTLPKALGIAAYPPDGTVAQLAGHLFVTDNNRVWDVDPIAKTSTQFAQLGSLADGLGFSEDGSLVFVALDGADVIVALDVATQALVWTSPNTGDGPDGVAVGLGVLSGYLYCNYNDGSVWEFGIPGGPHAGSQFQIATDGSRGDFIAIDPNTVGQDALPSLLLTQSDRILRLTPSAGGWVGPPSSTTVPVGAWVNLGYALPGVNGPPWFEGTGSLTVGSTGALTLTGAAPWARAMLVLSLGDGKAPFKGGTLVPMPLAAVHTLLTGAGGDVVQPFHMPVGVPAGARFYLQYAIRDEAGAQGVALSNALRADVP